MARFLARMVGGLALAAMAIAAWGLAVVDAESGLLGEHPQPAGNADPNTSAVRSTNRDAALRKLRTRPIDGGAVRELGDAALGAGDELAAHAYYQLASRRAPRDVLARRQLITHAVAHGRYADAAMHIDALLRVDPADGQTLLLQQAALLRREDFRAALADRLAFDPPWRAGLVGMMVALDDPATSQALLTQMAKVTALRGEENALRSSLLATMGRPLESREIWVQGLPTTAKQRLGRVFDGGFEYPHEAKPYGWQIQSQPGVTVGYDTAHRAEGRSSLLLLFDGRAADFSGVVQDLVLPPGAYRLTLQAQSDLPSTARPFVWTISCQSGREELARLPLPASTRGWQLFAAGFVVPSQCISQQLKLSHVARNISERQLVGRLAVDSVSISPVLMRVSNESD